MTPTMAATGTRRPLERPPRNAGAPAFWPALLATFALLAAAAPTPAQEPPPALREAIALVEQGDAAGAIALLEEQAARGALPDIASAALGALHLEAGNAERALNVLAPLAERDPPDPAALFNAGRAAEALGRFQDAASLYQRSIQLEPRSPALRALGMMIGRLGSAGDAYEYLRQWTATNPNDQDARLAAAWGAVALGRPPDAETLIEGLDPQEPQVQLLRGRILLLRDDPWGALAELQPLAEEPPAPLERGIRSALATAYLLVGEADGAIQQLESLSPEDPELAGRLARAYYQAGRTRDAIATLAPFVEPLTTVEPPADASTDLARELAYDYGRFLHAIEETERALPFLRLAADLDPDLAETFRALGQVLSALGRRDEAREAVQRYQELAAAADPLDMPQGDLEDPTGREVRTALERAGSGDADGALEALSREQRRAPTDPRPAIAASSVLLHAGRNEEALAAVEQGLVTSPGNPDGLYQRGAVLMAMRQLDEAESMFRRALAAAPGHIAALNDYAVLLMSQGREAEAAQHLRRVLQLRPDDPLARRHLDQIQGSSATDENPASDVEALRHATEVDPDNAAAWVRLGNALLLERSFRAAEDPLRRAVDLEPSNAEARFALASALWENNRPDEAELHAREASTLLPASPATHRLLGGILLWRGEYLKAAGSLERSVSLSEPDAEQLLELARAWEGAAGAEPGQSEELLTRAESAYRRATAMAPEHSEAVYGLAQVLRRLGRPEEAAEQMAEYQALYERDQEDARDPPP
ncbi:MAG: tetratricopeptide repeat protein [Holophagales bacterium]|nr:tetratricopeptide repeat protein [Holophagales bacterium]